MTAAPELAKEREWLVPSVVLTVVAGASALLFMPSIAGILPALRILPAWMAVAVLMACIGGFARMAARGVDSPIAETRRFLTEDWRQALFLAAVMLVAGLNMIAFMWVKPLLNYLVPFWADPLLADLDHALFLGNDPWALLSWLNFPAAGLVYHPIWFGMMILALLLTASAPASPQKSAMMLSYFLLWSVVGPAIHSLLPATGPVFYERMGYGDRFAGLDGGPETVQVADYLWSIYASKSFGAGAGISAMPSMHVTMCAWIVIAFSVFARKWLPFAAAGSLLVTLLSISLGWHYAADGIIGGAAAVICYVVLLALFRAKAAPATVRPATA